MDRPATAPVLRSHLKPLLNSSYPIEAVYVYGSAVSGKTAGDIDVLVIVNDTSPVSEGLLQKVEKACGKIKESAKKGGLEFHFQSPKLLSRWWHTLIEGEPWVISSLQSPVIIYDPKGVVSEVCRFIEKEHIYNREEKAERLLERSDSVFLQNRRLLLGTITNLANAGTEAAQIMLLFEGKFLLNKRAIVEELEKSYTKSLGRDVIDTYREIADLEEKVSKGTLSEFSAENLDYYLERIKIFISKVEEMLGRK
ncbi:MAG TPA: nucleotidyltransferase domain-containing protein [archaeon]|nr:nucleotidyltransferase domain-containing protein [archaeon]